MAFNRRDFIVNKDWPDSVVEDIQYLPWLTWDTWKKIECHSVYLKDDNVTEKGFIYRAAEDSSDMVTEETEQFQILRVQWLQNRGRSNFGYCVRIKDTSEVVVMIQQEDKYAWHWDVMLKYETLGLSLLEKKDGWLHYKLLANTINQVFHYLIQKK